MLNGPVKQALLFRDPRPLVERFGREFFLHLPQDPGVYLMRDAGEVVLYVGKARNLRKRLGSYRVANPDRLPRRHLRLLRAVARIDVETCKDEASALKREAALLTELRPRFNRAGTWKGPERVFSWRLSEAGLELAVRPAPVEGWLSRGPMRAGAVTLRACLARLLWCATHPEHRLVAMPRGWFIGRHGEITRLSPGPSNAPLLFEAARALDQLFTDGLNEFCAWVRARTERQDHPFEVAARDLDLELVVELIARIRREAN